MAPPRANHPINGYIELASPQILDDRWRELNFDLANGQNILQDLVVPESGGGYVYRDAQTVGSATHNRFLYWRTANEILELIEISTEVVLDGNQVRIRFANSPIINAINVIEFSESIVIMVATMNSVHRLYLPHPKTTNNSVLQELTTDVLFDTSNYYIMNNQSSMNSQQPICATSWYNQSMHKCALSFPDSSILIVQFGRNTHHISTSEIKQVGIMGRIWSRMPNLLTRSPNDCDNAVFICAPYHHQETNDVLLISLCRDWKIRIFSTNTKECVLTHGIVPQSSFSQSIVSHTNATTEQPMMKVYGSLIAIYLTESRPEFVLFAYSFEDGLHKLKEKTTIPITNWEKLIDFSVTEQKIWALANIRETESSLCYFDLVGLTDDHGDDGSELEGVWDFVNLAEDLDVPSVKNYVTEIFWRNHFSVATVQKALIGIAGPSIPKKTSMESLEELAFTKIVDDNQEEAWARFYNYCLQNHHVANKSLGLVVNNDESVISMVKRSNPSFICPWLMSVDMVLQGGPYRGIVFSTSLRSIIEPLNYISTELMDDEHSCLFEQELLEKPANILDTLSDIMDSLLESKKINISKLNFSHKNLISAGIDYICDELDLTSEAIEFESRILQESSAKLRSEHNPLESNSGITITFELFKRLVRARMILARDLLIYIHLMNKLSESEKSTSTEKFLTDLCQDLYTSLKVRRIADSMRSYAVLVWIAETPVKVINSQCNKDVINFISQKFQFFKRAVNINEKFQDSILEQALRQNLFMNFFANGGVLFSSPKSTLSDQPQTLSNSFYVTDMALNLCRLLWPKTNHICFAEFLFTHQLDEHLNKYLDLILDWLTGSESDRNFIRASNYLLQNRATQSVEIFNKLWMNMTYSNFIGRFIDLDKEKHASNTDDKVSVNPTLIYRYYDKLIQLFQLYNDHQSLVMLINHCMSLLDGNADKDQQHWINCFRAKLFQYYLELEEPDEAYHTMVLTSDPSLRINCLRKFIVSHCEKEQWSNLLQYPFIDIKHEFIDILNQKADSSDLSKLNGNDFYKTSYYDLLFASYVSDEDFRQAADIMYNYAQRLAHEVPGIISIRKQADCLLIALNALRCVPEKGAYIEFGALYTKEDGRSSVLKRAYDCESEVSLKFGSSEGDGLSIQTSLSRVYCKDIELKYELTRARLKLLEKDQAANAIALSPLKEEETIAQLVASSMYSEAVDLALFFKVPMEPILEGLTAKYIFIMRLSSVDIAMHRDLERALSDIFTNSYSNIDTYNYIANSTSTSVEKLWRLIDYYLTTYDGVSHRYSTDSFSTTFANTTVLMRVVATKILSAGYDIPASLRRMYMTRNTAELVKLMVKYDKLTDAAELVIEMMDKVLEPSNCFAFTSPFTTSDPPPVYLPTHLILLLMTFLTEDATNTYHVKTADILNDKLNKFRHFVRLS